MKDLSNTTLWDFLESIREKTRENILLIRHNKKTITSIEEKLLSSTRINPETLLELKNKNKQLSEENFQLLELHKSIISLGNMYGLYSENPEDKESVSIPKYSESSEPEYMTLIKDGEFNADKHFYWLDDEEIAEEIYETLLKLEQYEECAKILRYNREHKDSFNPTVSNAFKWIFFWKK